MWSASWWTACPPTSSTFVVFVLNTSAQAFCRFRAYRQLCTLTIRLFFLFVLALPDLSASDRTDAVFSVLSALMMI
jgi:hypothetical protein